MGSQLVLSNSDRNVRSKEIKLEETEELQNILEEKKNKDFVMFFRENMPEVRWLMINHPFASAVYFFITEHMDGKNSLACSYALMSDYFQRDRSTIHRAINILKDNGFLTIMKMGNSNVYLVNSDVAWTSYNNQKSRADIQYAALDGKILVSRKENMDYELRNQSERFKKLGKIIKKEV